VDVRSQEERANAKARELEKKRYEDMKSEEEKRAE
jgi:hypothetical protein